VTDRPKNQDLEAIARQVQQSVISGRADSDLAAGQEARQMALDALSKAEHLDPRKLRRPISI